MQLLFFLSHWMSQSVYKLPLSSILPPVYVYSWGCCCCCYVALVVSDSVRPHRRQPTRENPRLWDSPGKNTGVGCHFLLQYMKMKSESEVTQSCPTLATPWTTAYQAPLSIGFSRQEYWSGMPLPSLAFNLTYLWNFLLKLFWPKSIGSDII